MFSFLNLQNLEVQFRIPQKVQNPVLGLNFGNTSLIAMVI